MTLTKKFSQFTAANLNSSSAKIVGYDGSDNIQADKVQTWTTLTRPASPFNGLFGYNTNFDQYEYYNGSLLAWVQLANSSGGLNWTTITVSQLGILNNGYVTNGGGVVSVTLPATAIVGDRVAIMGKGTGGWSLVANAGQIIHLGNTPSSTAGSVSSTNQYDNVEATCLVADTEWQITSVIGNLTVL